MKLVVIVIAVKLRLGLKANRTARYERIMGSQS